jgi:hypothetical protein
MSDLGRGAVGAKKGASATKEPVVFREWSPYGSLDPNVQPPGNKSTANNNNANDQNKTVVFRGWSAKPSNSTTSKEVDKLEQESDKYRRQLHELREHGRQVRLHRLQALDALETRRVTLTEILRRMEKELNDRDVYEYGDVLAEVFGERKIYAHRAVGLEALLCQYMHQMLSKQHQLKIMKRAGKDIEGLYRKSKHNIKDSFHSYEALCVQLEASRLTLEDMYDDIFASQHRILAQLKHVESGGDMTNYSIPSPAYTKSRKEPSMKVSSRHPDSDAEEINLLRASPSGDPSLTDQFADILSTPKNADGLVLDDEMKEEHLIKTAAETAAAILANPLLRTNTNTPILSPITDDRPTTSRRSPEDGMTARERRREIEKKRLAHPSRISTPQSIINDSHISTDSEEDEAQRARNRLRELEAKAASKSVKSSNVEEDDDDNDDGELKERNDSPRSKSKRKN